MPVSSVPAVLGQLKAGRPDRVYLLVGDDETGKGPLVSAFEGLVEEDLRAFNLERLYANEADLLDVIAAARTLPFVGGHRVVVVLRAETFLKPKGKAAIAEPEPGQEETLAAEGTEESEEAALALLELERYIADPSPATTLVLVAADVHRGTRLGKLTLKQATMVEFWGFRDDARGRNLGAAFEEAERWVRKRVREQGCSIDEDAAERILAHAGADIAVLRGDVERVVTFCAGRDRITLEDVLAVVGGAVSHDDWTLVRAIERGDVREALRQLHLVLDAGRSPYLVLGQLGYFVRSSLPRLVPARVPAGVRALFDTDLAMKTSGGDLQVLLERLVMTLCGEGVERRGGTARRFTPRPAGR